MMSTAPVTLPAPATACDHDPDAALEADRCDCGRRAPAPSCCVPCPFCDARIVHGRRHDHATRCPAIRRLNHDRHNRLQTSQIVRYLLETPRTHAGGIEALAEQVAALAAADGVTLPPPPARVGGVGGVFLGVVHAVPVFLEDFDRARATDVGVADLVYRRVLVAWAAAAGGVRPT